MLSEIRLRNFKGFGEETQTAPLGRKLTLIYGPNSGGKSSIFHALLLMKQSLNSRYINARGQLVDLASFKNIIHNHDTDSNVEIGFSVEPDKKEIFWDKDTSYDLFVWDVRQEIWNKSKINFDFTLSYKNNNGKCVSTKFNLKYVGEPIYTVYNYGCHKDIRDKWFDKFICELNPPAYYNKEKEEFFITNDTVKNWKFLIGIKEDYIKNNIHLLKNYIYNNQLSGLLPSPKDPLVTETKLEPLESIEYTIINAAGKLRENIERVKYFGPFRIPPKRYYEYTCRNATSSLNKDGANAILLLYKENNNYLYDSYSENKKKPLDELNEVLKIIGIEYKVNIEKVRDDIIDITGELLCMTLEKDGIQVSPQDVGFGISQIMPIIIQGILCKNSIIIVEQPELHIHPLLVANLAEFFLYNSYKNNNQWLVETHNSNIAARIQRIIIDGKFSRFNDNEDYNILYRDCKVLFVDKEEKGVYVSEKENLIQEADKKYTTCIIKTLGYTSDGLLDDWPTSFVDANDVIAKYNVGR